MEKHHSEKRIKIEIQGFELTPVHLNNNLPDMVVMESVCGVEGGGSGAGAGHDVGSGRSAWYDSSSVLAAQTSSSADELADAYFKGHNYFSQVQGAYQGMSHGV